VRESGRRQEEGSEPQNAADALAYARATAPAGSAASRAEAQRESSGPVEGRLPHESAALPEQAGRTVRG
jgi:hypothetical protein